MVLICAIGVAAAAYAAQNDASATAAAAASAASSSADGTDGGVAPPHPTSEEAAPPPPDLADKVPIDLLPLERTLALFEAPITTVTFLDGDPTIASEYLRRRVADIAYRNPWLGGWLARDGRRGVRLYYDPTSDDVAPGLFRPYEPGRVPLSRDSPPESYGPAFDGRGVVVGCNAALVGRAGPLWRASLIPDADRPDDRFALVVSMSHMVGDGHTYFRVYDMLHSRGKVEALNPIRKHEFGSEVSYLMGSEEAYYVDRVSRSPLWARFRRDDTVVDRKVFYLDQRWVEGQKREWTKRGEGSGGPTVGGATLPKNPRGGAAGGGNLAVSFAAPQMAQSLTTSDVVTSWFFRTVGATVGLMLYNFRDRLGTTCADDDAGNYCVPVPYTARDYATPDLIRASRSTARRANADDGDRPTVLPPHGRDSRYAISADWRSFQRRGGLTLGEGGECRQVLMVPYHNHRDLECVPKSFSFLQLFNAGPEGEPAVSVFAPRPIMAEVEGSGMVGETISGTAGSSEDAFLDSVREAATGRRKSAYVSLIDAGALAMIEDGGEEE